MTFFSPEFAFLFMIFFIIYWSFKEQILVQKILILVTSYGFLCVASVKFAIILFAYSCFVYGAGILLLRRNGHGARLFLVLLGAVCFLCFFKYFSYIREYFALITDFFGLAQIESIALPLGISYYTFMSITYLVAVFKKEYDSADALSLFCYLAFFPSVVMGPIGRASARKNSRGYTKIYPVLPQFNERKTFAHGDKIFASLIIGAFKVFVICGHLTPYVNGIFGEVYGDLSEISGVKILVAILLYSFVIYTNFSGFIDIARAIAMALGFRLPRNFHMPYTARNIDEFWDRWHISLSTFIRDYIYIPLGGNCGYGPKPAPKKLPKKLSTKKKKKILLDEKIKDALRPRRFWRMNFNIMIAFLLSGIWHGVGLNFAIWGALHGVACVAVKCMRAMKLAPLNRNFAVLCTFFYVSFTWIFFANTDFNDIKAIFSALVNAKIYGSISEIFVFMVIIIFVLIYPKFLLANRLICALLAKMPTLVKGAFLGLVFSAIYALMPSGIPNFIYASF